MLEEIEAFLEANKDNEEVKAQAITLLQGYIPAKEIEIDTDKVKTFLESNQEGKSFFDSEKDKHSSKSLETWKTNNLNKLIEEELKKRNPSKDPRDLEIEEIKNELAQSKRTQFQKDMLIQLKDKAIDSGVPSNLVHLLVGDDEDTTFKNFEAFETSWKQEQEKVINGLYQKEGYNPKNNNTPPKTFTVDQIAKMTEQEIMENMAAIDLSLQK